MLVEMYAHSAHCYIYSVWRETDYSGSQCNILCSLLLICLLSVPIVCVVQQIYALLTTIM